MGPLEAGERKGKEKEAGEKERKERDERDGSKHPPKNISGFGLVYSGQ